MKADLYKNLDEIPKLASYFEIEWHGLTIPSVGYFRELRDVLDYVEEELNGEEATVCAYRQVYGGNRGKDGRAWWMEFNLSPRTLDDVTHPPIE